MCFFGTFIPNYPWANPNPEWICSCPKSQAMGMPNTPRRALITFLLGEKIISYFIGKTTINILLINYFASFKEDYKFSGPNETPRAPGHGHVSKYNEVLNRRQIIFYLKIFNNFIISNNHNTLVNPIWTWLPNMLSG